MNDKNIQKQKLPLALKLNLNKNKETVDSSFSVAGKLENAPIYNNSITNYFEKTEQNNGPTVYDEDNNKYTVDVQGNVITKDISLFTIDLTKFEKEEIENVDNVVSYDNGWKLINNGAVYTLTNDTDSYSITVDNVIDARVRVVKGLPTYCIIYNNKDGNHCVKAGYVKNGALQSLAAAKEVVYYYWKGIAVANLTTSSNIKISTINADYTDLQLIENSRLANATPLIQISNPYGDYIAFSILYKKGLIHNDEFAFATFYVNTDNNNWYKDENGSSTITYDFDEKQVVKIKITLRIYYAMAFEGPVHHFGYNNGVQVFEIVPAGSFIEGAAAVVMLRNGTLTALDEPVTVKMNYSWEGYTEASFNVGGRANLPIKYGRRRVTSYDPDTYEILDYQTLSGDGSTNWNKGTVLDYNQVYGAIKPISIPAGSDDVHYNKTNMVLEDTQVAIFFRAGDDIRFTTMKIKKNGAQVEDLYTFGMVYGRNKGKPKITSLEITYRGTTETIDIPSNLQTGNVFYCYDEYNNSIDEWFARQPAGGGVDNYQYWFSNEEYYVKTNKIMDSYTHNFYNNNDFKLAYSVGEKSSWKNSIPLSRMYYYSQHPDYGFHKTVDYLKLGSAFETERVWCLNRHWLDLGNKWNACLPAKKMYEMIFKSTIGNVPTVADGSQYDFEPTALGYILVGANARSSILMDYKIYFDFITRTLEVNGEDSYPAEIPGTQTPMPPPLEPKYIMDDGSLYYSGYHSFNSSIAQTDCYGYKGHMSNMSIEGGHLKLTWVVDNFLLINSGNENKYYKGDTRYINQGVYNVTNAWSNPITPYADSSPTNGPDWDANDRWYFNYYDNNLNRMVSNPGVISEESYIKYGSAMYAIPAYYHSMGASASMGNWNLLYNEAVGGLTLSGISYSPNSASMRGTLVTPWYSLNDNAYISYEGDKIYFKDRNNKWNKVSLALGYDVKIMFNRYIIFNTTSFWNAYDMKTKQKLHYADDWNNRISLGISSVQDNAAAIETNNNLTILLASGIGEQYTMEEVKDLPSMIFNPVAKKYWNGDSTFFTYKDGGDPNINVYNTSTSSTIPTYLYSIKNGRKITDNNLNNVYFPVSSSGYMYVNPDMFMKVLRSYKNTDMFLEEDTAYAVNYYNNNPVMIYNFTSEQRGLQGLFVLQTMTYGIINNYIYSLTYSNNLITSSEPVCSVEGMKFVGFLPNAAYFYSKKNRTLYEFTGDANLTVLTECTEIEDILNTYYDTATKTIYWLTPKGFVVYSGDYCYTIPTENVDTFYTTNSDILIKYKDYSTKFLRFEPAEDYTKLPYKILTSPYGADNNTISKLSNMYIQTVNDFVDKEDSVKITSYSYTDTEVKSSNKTFERKAVIPYIPEYDCGTGTAFEIEGTIPIKGIVIDVNPIGASQKVNINTGVIR